LSSQLKQRELRTQRRETGQDTERKAQPLRCVRKRRLTYRIGNLFDRLNVIARDELVVSVEKFNSSLLERTLCQKETLDSRKTWKKKTFKAD
jgi:hypothetical protein